MPSKNPRGKKHQESLLQNLNRETAMRVKLLIESEEELPNATILSLLKSDCSCHGLYSKACKGNNGNTNCLCSLIPAPESYRRSGLWAKQAHNALNLGLDPATLKREHQTQPVGLRNLGNTCYVNSVIQCLFANQEFRSAIYAVQPPVSEQPAIKELRHLFLELEYGPTSPVDPSSLVGALQLDHGVQQDGHEFMKLLLTMLEMQFSRQPEVKDIIPALFRGKSGYETVCQSCHRPSESSSRDTAFYELDVPVKGFKSLQESLGTLLAPEFLFGDNQYSCDYCGCKVDATRQLRLRILPPVLCLSLQRFVFDFNKMDRVKANDKFSFPLELDVAPFLGQAGLKEESGTDSTSAIYDLVAILIHKGGSAMHGHYVAHIKMESNRNTAGCSDGQLLGAHRGWWRFDDEGVTPMKGGPCTSSDHGVAAAMAAEKRGSAEAKEDGGSRKRQKSLGGGGRGGRGQGRGRGGRGRGRKGAAAAVDLDLVGEDSGSNKDAEAEGACTVAAKEACGKSVPGDQGAGADKAAPRSSSPASEIVSQNAYLLVYRQRGADVACVKLDEATQQWLTDARVRLAAEYEQRCKTYAATKESVAQCTAQRQREVRSIVEAAVSVPADDHGRFISRAWLQVWADADASKPVEPIDNSNLLCQHGKLDPGKTPELRRISTHAWEQLRGSCKGGPELQPSDICRVCLADRLAAVASLEDSQERRDRFVTLAAELEEERTEEAQQNADYLISRQWLSAWRKRRGRSMGTTSPTAAITCPHGHLAPEQLVKQTKRIAIPTNFYEYLKECWDAAVEERQRKQQSSMAAVAASHPSDVEVLTLDSDGDVASPQQCVAQPLDSPDHPPVAPANSPSPVKPAADPAGAAAAGTDKENSAGMGMAEFRSGCEECAVCLVELSAAAELAQDLKGRREAEKAVLAHLVSAPPVTQPQPGRPYAMVPWVFMEQWRAYMAQAGRKAVTPGTVAHPPSLRESMKGLMCSCHRGEDAMLAFPPPAMVNKRGRWVVGEQEGPGSTAAATVGGVPGDSMWQLLEQADWQALAGMYGDGDERLGRGVTAVLHVATDEEGAAGGEGKQEGSTALPANGRAAQADGDAFKLDESFEMEVGDDYLIQRKQGNRGGRRAWLEVQPPVCGATVSARQEAAKAALLTYADVEVMVEVVPSLEEATARPAQGVGGERKSKRARKGRAPIKASSGDTLRALRLRIYESVDVHPGNARLFVRGSLLDHDDAATLAECEIYPHEEIKVMDSGEYDSADYASVVSFYGADAAPGRKVRQREAERGFTGTALHGLHPGDGEREGGALDGMEAAPSAGDAAQAGP